MSETLITYVYDGKEVCLTGRVATSTKDGTMNQASLVEIVPVGVLISDKTYAKWVKLSELMFIHNIEEQQEAQ